MPLSATCSDLTCGWFRRGGRVSEELVHFSQLQQVGRSCVNGTRTVGEHAQRLGRLENTSRLKPHYNKSWEAMNIVVLA